MPPFFLVVLFLPEDADVLKHILWCAVSPASSQAPEQPLAYSPVLWNGKHRKMARRIVDQDNSSLIGGANLHTQAKQKEEFIHYIHGCVMYIVLVTDPEQSTAMKKSAANACRGKNYIK